MNICSYRINPFLFVLDPGPIVVFLEKTLELVIQDDRLLSDLKKRIQKEFDLGSAATVVQKSHYLIDALGNRALLRPSKVRYLLNSF